MKRSSLTWARLFLMPVLCLALSSACGGGSSSPAPQDGASADHTGDSGGGDGAATSDGGGVDTNVGKVDSAPFVTTCDQNPCDGEYTRCAPVFGGTGCVKACPGMPCPSGQDSWCTRTGGLVCLAPQ